jgi:hypothetical protein
MFFLEVRVGFCLFLQIIYLDSKHVHSYCDASCVFISNCFFKLVN